MIGSAPGQTKAEAVAAAQRIFVPQTNGWTSPTGENYSFVGAPIIARDQYGTKYAIHDGGTLNFYTTPDSVAASVTGDITVAWSGQVDTLTPATYTAIVDKWGSIGNYSYSFLLDAIGKINFNVSIDGMSSILSVSTATLGSVGVTAGSRVWIYATRVAATGVVQFFYSLDGVNYSKLGNDVNNTAGNIFDSTAIVAIGIRAQGLSRQFAGKTYRARIFAGIGITGTPVVDFNPAEYINLGGGNRQGALLLMDPVAMYAAPDGVALAGSGVAGLMLDQSKDLISGPNIATGGDFTSSSGWLTTGSGHSITDGKVIAVNASGQLYRAITLTNGNWYKVRYTVSEYVSGFVKTGFGASFNFATGPQNNANGTFTAILQRTAADAHYIGLSFTSFTGKVDDLVIEELYGYHAQQSTLASRPPVIVTPQTLRRVFVPTTQSLVATFGNLGSCTVVRWLVDGTTTFTTETISGAWQLLRANELFCGCAIVSGTLDETQKNMFRQLGGWYRPGLDTETIVNGDFTSGIASWTANNATLSWDSNGYLIMDVTGLGGGAVQPKSCVAGAPYYVDITLKKLSYAGSLLHLDFVTSAQQVITYTMTSSFVRYQSGIIANGSSGNIGFRRGDGNIGTIVIDKISIKRIN